MFRGELGDVIECSIGNSFLWKRVVVEMENKDSKCNNKNRNDPIHRYMISRLLWTTLN